MNKDYDPTKCPLYGLVVLDPMPGTRCPGTCTSYLVLVLKGQKRGKLKWHHPLECMEEKGPCWPCALYQP